MAGDVLFGAFAIILTVLSLGLSLLGDDATFGLRDRDQPSKFPRPAPERPRWVRPVAVAGVTLAVVAVVLVLLIGR